MKRIAICYYGLSDGKNDKNNTVSGIEKSLETVKKNIVGDMEYDIFFHTWFTTDDTSKKLVDLYNPKKYIIEPQKTFASNVFDKKELNTSYKSGKSRWFSHKAVIELVNDYSTENNVDYDIVFVTRFDGYFMNDFELSKLNIADKLYVSNWEPSLGTPTPMETINKHGLCDIWWFGKLNIINKFKDVYDFIDVYKNEIYMSSHLMSYLHIKKNNIPIAFHKYILKDYDITRRVS
jgi:hypothetical protein